MKYAPEVMYACRIWLRELAFPFPVHMYNFAYGNSLVQSRICGKIPSSGPIDQSEISEVFPYCAAD